MSAWSHIILEGFCMYAWASKKVNHMHIFDTDKMECTGEIRTEKNPHYIHHSKRPKKCREENPERIPNPFCYDSECPFFAGCSASEPEHQLFYEVWSQYRTKDRREEP